MIIPCSDSSHPRRDGTGVVRRSRWSLPVRIWEQTLNPLLARTVLSRPPDRGAHSEESQAPNHAQLTNALGVGNDFPVNRDRRKVVIVQSTLRHYRVKFFLALRDKLAESGVELRVIYSNPDAHEAKKRDCVDLDSEIGMKVPANWLLYNRLVYQRAWRQLADADLVIVEHASKHLLNYALFAYRVLSRKKVALWGHGFNRGGTRLGRFMRDRTLHSADWWFAYSGVTMRYLLANGVPERITTNVQNAIDTEGFAEAVDKVSPEQVAALRFALGIGANARVGLFCGSLYVRKRLPMLIASSALIRNFVPQLDFHLVIVGDGPARNIAEDATDIHPWIHYAGPKFGADRAPYFRIADVLLNPGLVGLGILDAFAAGLPILTTDIPVHSPEIDYLEDGHNGVCAPDDTCDYADAIIGVLRNQDLLSRLRDGAQKSSGKYTLANMVRNFSGGVVACLESERTPVIAWSSPRQSRASNS